MRQSWLYLGVATACVSLFGAPPVAHAQTTTETQSAGTIEYYDYRYDGRRNDSYSTHIRALLPGGETFFDQYSIWSVQHANTLATLAQITSHRAYALDGRPAVLVWSAPVLVDQYEEFLDSFTEVSYTTETAPPVVTFQTTYGDADNNIVYFGERGICYDVGVTGATNGANATGAFANCDYAEEMYVESGVINTNTHTTYTIVHVENWFTNEDFLTVSELELTSTAVLVGGVHTSVQTSLFDAGDAFLNQLGQEGEAGATPDLITLASLGPVPATSGRRVRAWGGGYGERSSIGEDAAERFDRTTSGIAGGLVGSRAPWTLGAAVDHRAADIEMSASPEEADLDLTQLGAHAGYVTNTWFANAVVSAGFGESETKHGSAALGGVSTAQFDVSTLGVGIRGGYRVRAGDYTVPLAAGVDWVQVQTDDFVETGGVPLSADDYEADRTSAWVGAGIERRWDWSNRMWLDVRARARLVTTLNGATPVLPVAFVAAPGAPLEISGYSEDGVGEASLAFVLGFSDAFALYMALNGSGNDEEESYGVSGGLRARW